MTLLINSFEEGANGTTITTSNAANAVDNGFDIVNIASGAVNRFSGLYQAHGAMSGMVSTGGTAGATNFGWSTSLGTVTTLYGRAYILAETYSGFTSDAIIRFLSSGTFGGGIQLSSAGNIQIQNSSFANTATSATVVAAGAWVRIEWTLVCGAAGVGSLTVNIYYSATGPYDTTTVTETLTDNTSAWGVSGSVNQIVFGWNGSHANQPALHFDDVAVSTTGLIGPAVTAPTYDAFPTNPLDFYVSMFIGGAWADITHLCLENSDIQISQRGRPDETEDVSPANLTLTLNNANGIFSPNNPSSVFYPWLQQNVRISVYIAAKSANGTVYTGYRFIGDVRKLPPSWDQTGTYNYINITAGGLLTRYVQGGNIGSALRRYYTVKPYTGYPGGSPADTASPLYPISYWPCEELTGASSFQNMIPTGSQMTWAGSPQLSSDSALASSDPIPQINGSTWTGNTNSYSIQGPVTWNKPGRYQWICPGGITSLTTVEAWGGGGGGCNGFRPVAGAGGEYAKDTTVAVTPGNTYNVYVGSGGAGGVASGGSLRVGSYGQNSYFQADSITTKAHGGGAVGWNTFTSRGGTGSTSATHNAGGSGGLGNFPGGGGGGGGSGGSASAGNNGSNASGNTGGAGATAVTGGGKGGTGESFQSGGNYGGGGLPREYVIRYPAPGGTPGGGGGGGSAQNSYGPYYGPGQPGGPGQVTINFASASVPNNVVIRFVVDIPSSGMPDGAVLLRAVVGSGTLGGGKIECYYSVANSGLGFRGYNSSSTLIFDTGTSGTPVTAGVGPMLVSLEMAVSGNISCELWGVTPGNNSLSAPIGAVYSGTIGTISQIIVNPNGNILDTAIGHITLQYALDPSVNIAQALGGFEGELYLDRIKRICAEEGLPCVVQSDGFWSWDTASPYMNSYTEAQLYNWYGVSSLLNMYPDWLTFGTQSLLVSASTTSSGAAAKSPQVPISAGQYASVWMDINTLGQSGTYEILMTFYDNTGASTGNKHTTVNIPAPFLQYTISLQQQVAPANTTSMDIEVFNTATPSFTGQQFAIDNVSLAIGVRMGAQPDESLLTLLEEIEHADRGLLIEPRDFYGIRYRSRSNLLMNDPVLTADYSLAQLAEELQPVWDEQLLRNNVTISRINGGSVNIQKTTGAQSVQTPPSGVGNYPYSDSVNLYQDSQLPNVAAWVIYVGTAGDYRYTSIVFDMTRSEVQSLFGTIPAVDGGDHIKILNANPVLPSTTVDQLAMGFDETINTFKWTIDFTGVPESPYALDIDNSGDFWNTGNQGSWAASGGALTVVAGTQAAPSPYNYYLQHVTSVNAQYVAGAFFTVTPSTSYTLIVAVKAVSTTQISIQLSSAGGATLTMSGNEWAFAVIVVTTGSAQTTSNVTIESLASAPSTIDIGYVICIPTSEVLSW
jgi:hypothetical protein